VSETEYAGYEKWKKWPAETFGKFTKADATYYEAEISRTGLSFQQGLHVFELGFGNGSFAGWAQSQGFKYAGSELIPELLNRASSLGIRAFGTADDVVTKLGVGFRSGLKRILVKAARRVTSGFINTVFHDAQPRVITSNLVFVLRKSK